MHPLLLNYTVFENIRSKIMSILGIDKRMTIILPFSLLGFKEKGEGDYYYLFFFFLMVKKKKN